MIVTLDEVAKGLLRALDNAVQHIPEDRQEAVKSQIFQQFAYGMMSMPMQPHQKDDNAA